uniref:Uncharacterized protein n=1 Tax=Arundo donax TaxID=35708 RepID=A0A0A8XVJ4_ARUDO
MTFLEQYIYLAFFIYMYKFTHDLFFQRNLSLFSCLDDLGKLLYSSCIKWNFSSTMF